MQIDYKLNPSSMHQADHVLRLFEQAGIEKPKWTSERMQRSISGSTSVVCAWHEGELIGFASAISDGAWIAYLSQLAVKPEYQRKGVGKSLVGKLLEDLGDEVTVVVHSAENASKFYASIGFNPYSNVLVKIRKI